MTLSGQNFEVYQGDNKEIIITVRNEDGSLLNLDGYEIVWCVHNQTLANVVFQKKTSDGSITVPVPASGEIHILLEQEDTHDLPTKNYGHQCEISDAFENHATIMTGYMRVLRSITHHTF
jgi:hypothetical protein